LTNPSARPIFPLTMKISMSARFFDFTAFDYAFRGGGANVYS